MRTKQLQSIVVGWLVMWVSTGSVLAVNYYVNDSTTNEDMYCTAPGSDTNNGLTGATPLASFTNLLGMYSLGPNDVVYIDTGLYSNKTFSLGSDDCGSAAGYVTFQGSTNGTLIKWYSTSGYGVYLNSAPYVRFNNILFEGAQFSAFARGSRNVEFSKVECANASYAAVRLENGSPYGRFEHCIFRGFGSYGVILSISTADVMFDGCVFYNRNALFSYAASAYVSNCIFTVAGSDRYAFIRQAGGLISSDHNVFYFSSGATPYSGCSFLSDYQQRYGQDWNSIVMEPAFADAGSGDFHLQSVMGRWDGSAWVTDAVHSVAIDMGSSLSPYSEEPTPNGARVNAGCYGNTYQASQSRTNRWLQALTYNDGGELSGTGDVFWAVGNCDSNDTVRLEYSLDAGQSWGLIQSNIPATNANAAWDSTVHASSARGKWRVLYEDYTDTWSTIERFVTIHNSNLFFYVNDTSTVNDVYTTGKGFATNSGTDVAFPKSDISQILSDYIVSPGDVIYVDTGVYELTNQIKWTDFDEGDNDAYITLMGSTNGSLLSLDSSAQEVLLLDNADYLSFSNLQFSGGNYNLQIDGSRGINIHRCNFDGASLCNMRLDQNTGCRIENCLLQNAGSYVLEAVTTSTSNYMGNCVIYNSKGLFSYANSSIIISNSIVSVSGSGNYAFVEQSGGRISSDYNLYDLNNDAAIFAGVNNLAEYQKNYGEDFSSTVLDPLFADPGNDDFHLRSVEGRWTGTNFIKDVLHSPAIDMGYPGSDFSNETMPNGGVVNVGRYGNTSQASRSRTNEWLQALSYNDGGLLNAGEDYVYWRSGNVATDATVMIQLSRDSGSSWITVATNITVTNNAYLWSNTNQASSVYARWRVVLESDTNVVGSSEQDCSFRNGPFVYYVNDDSLEGDIYTDDVGNDANLGVSPSTPKSRLRTILNTYDLEAGDIVYIDTGRYELSANQTINAYDSGTNGNPVRIVGSTNYSAGGSVFDRNRPHSGGYALEFSAVNGPVQDVSISDVKVENAFYGVQVDGASRILLERVSAYNTAIAGMSVQDCSNVTVRECVSRDGSIGVRISGSDYIHLEHSVVWQQTNVALKVESGWVTATNCAFGAYGNIAYLYYAPSLTNILGDYNAFSAEREAVVGYVAAMNRTCNTLADWRGITACEIRSFDGNPLFADADNGDFHLKTITPLGRRTPEGGYTSDIETSPLIDSGCPSWSYTNEPTPNGGRVNIGLFGNTWQASIGRTNAWVYATSLNEGGGVQGTSCLHWVTGNEATNDLVQVEYSWDGGASWSILTSDVPVGVTEFYWDTTLTNDTPAGLWRVSSLDDTNLVSQTTNFFSIRNNPLDLYVNDAYTNSDVYTATFGFSNNWRAASDCPQDSLITVLGRYDLQPGDTIWVDTGSFTNERNVRFGRYQSGSSTNPLRLVGSTGALHTATVIDRNGTNRNAFALQCDKVAWVTFSNITVQGGSCGASITNSSNIRLSLCARDNQTNGVEVLNSSSITLSRCILEQNTRSAICNASSSGLRIENSLVRSNNVGLKLLSGTTTVRQNILQDSGRERYLFNLSSGTISLDTDYNDILAEQQANVALVAGKVYRSLAEWQIEGSNDLHSLSHEPRFADPANNDYHVESIAGRYTESGVVTDLVTSVLIDTGDPSDAYSLEPVPNGDRVNIGLYGDNGEASRSETNGWLLALTLNSGGFIRGTNYIYWAVGGTATGNLVYIDFSEDGGLTWTNIGTNIQANEERFLWNTTNQPPTALGVWRVVSQVDTGIYGQTENYFAIKNEPLGYYVNDASTNGDVYCTEPGSAANNGLRPSTPKDSVQELIDTYALMPGDRVLIDTGSYVLTNELTIDDLHGSDTNFVYFTGSTNTSDGGSRLYVQRGKAGIKLESSSRIAIEGLFITNAPVGVHLLESSDCYFEQVVTERCGDGFRVEGASSNFFLHCGSSAFLTNGVFSIQSQDEANSYANEWNSGVLISAAWVSNSLVLTTGCCIRVQQGELSVSNSVLYAAGRRDVAMDLSPGVSYSGDFNDYYLTNADYMVVWRQPAPVVPTIRYLVNLGEWQTFSSLDAHSLAVVPGFHDDYSDWHLVSQEGRYNRATEDFVSDAQSSLLLDAADPAALYTNETYPNGLRRNVGCYGNATEASRTPTNSYYTMLTVNDGGIVLGADYMLQWVPHGNATGHTVVIDYSWDGGVSWTTVVSGVEAHVGFYEWDTTLFSNSVFGLWRIGSQEELYDTITNQQYFVLRNGPLFFYVNDGTTNGDVYCESVGADTNTGLTVHDPLLSAQDVIDSYDLEGGDVIYIDTGIYSDRVSYVVNQWDSGCETNRMMICGSTNFADGGSFFAGVMFRLRNTLGVEMRNLVIEADSRYGVQMENCDNTVLEAVHVYGAADGYHLTESANASFQHCVASSCFSNGFYCLNSTNVEWRSGVLWSNTVGISAEVEDQGLVSMNVHHSILAAGGGAQGYVLAGARLTADYNNYYLCNGAMLASESASPLAEKYVTVSRWARDTGRDRHSLSRDPMFVAPAVRNFQLSSLEGRKDIFSGSVVTDTVSSCLIDAGDPDAVYSDEPMPNGNRLNIGLYGNTEYAAMTPSNGSLTVVALNDGGRAEGTNVLLYWVSHGNTTGHTVKLEYSADNGDSWQEIASGLPADTNYIWNTLMFTSSVRALWRVSSLEEPAVYDQSDEVFALRNAPIHFYVNDDSLVGDMYTTAIGASTNLGLSPAQPKDTIASIVDTYDLESGDVLFVDTGDYDVDDSVVFGQLDSAQETNTTPMYVLGSTNEMYGGTRLACNSQTYGVLLREAIGIALENFQVDEAQSVNLAVDDCYDVTLTNCHVRGGNFGMTCEKSENVALRHCAVENAAQAGLYLDANLNMSFEYGVLWSNAVLGVDLADGNLSFSNNIICMYDGGAYAYRINGVGLKADYNCIFLTNGAKAVYQYANPLDHIYDNVSLWVRAEGRERHSLTVDPLFANPGLHDFHLKSTRGHYDVSSGMYVNDSETSPLIDAGAPGADYAEETVPNGGRVNIGLYGNTDQASKTPTNAAFSVITLNDGGRTEGQAQLYWVAYGDATGHTVRLEFSSDAGSTWQLIVAGIPAAQGYSVWSTILFDSTMLGRWRVVSEDDPSVYAESREFFAVRNDPLSFYVNDNSLVGDMYCSEVGYSTNYGVESAAPKESLKELLDQWDVEPGDTIYIDTGYYLIPETITIDNYDAGEMTNDPSSHVTIMGSTRDDAGGSIFDLYTGQNGLRLQDANGLDVKYLKIRHAGTGLSASRSHFSSADFVTVKECSTGFNINNCDPFDLIHCIVADSTRGLYCDHEDSQVVWQNGILWSNRYGVYKAEGSLTVLNSAISAFGKDQFAYYIYDQYSALTTVFNNIYLANDAYCAGVKDFPDDASWTTRYDSVAVWQDTTGNDTYSLSGHPGFYDPVNGDFHLKSSSGRYRAGMGWTNDSITTSSRLIDSGKPASVYDEEPMPNGGRVNIGCYGNTAQASMTPTQGWITLVFPKDTFDVQGGVPIRWITGWVATGHTIRIDFSADFGYSWTNIVTGLPPAWNGYYLWNSDTYARSALALIKVSSEDDPSIWDQSDRGVLRTGGTIPYYVNDDSTDGDVYCSAVGNDNNDGLTTNTPKRTIQAIFDEYRLAPVDTIYVDSGEYSMTHSLVIDDSDKGLGTNHVVVQGSTNAAVPTILDRGGVESYVIELNGTRGIELRDLVLKNGAGGVNVGGTLECELIGLESSGHSGVGISLSENSADIRLINCRLWGNSGAGVMAEEAEFAMENCLCWSDTHAVRLLEGSVASVTNCIMRSSGSGSRVFHLDRDTSVTAVKGDYNDYVMEGGALFAEKVKDIGGNDYYGYLLDWQRATTQELYSLSVDPVLVDAESGDFRLRSVAGRYVPGQGWTNDTVNSPLLDVGFPGSSYTNEPSPNGSRINIGPYGNTWQASMSRTNPWLRVLSLGGGGTVRNAIDLKWTSGLLSNGSLVRLEYTANGGVTWPAIASNIENDVSHYYWDVSEMPLSAQTKWRVVWQDDTNVVDESGWFPIKNHILNIYVNDQSTAGDVFTLATGSDVNSGTNPAVPLASPYTAMNRYPLGAGDTIWIDTGYYALTNDQNLELNAYTRGDNGSPISLVGSWQEQYGGSVIDLQGLSNDVLKISDTQNICVSNLVLRGALGYGVRVSKTVDCRFSGLNVMSNGAGVYLYEVQPTTMDRCRVWENRGRGIALSVSSLRFDQGVVCNNDQDCFAFSASSLMVSNSILVSAGSSLATVFRESESTYAGDFNVFNTQEGNRLGFLSDIGQYFYSLVQWQQEHLGQDVHSMRLDPAFVDPSNGNFRVMSQAGHHTFAGYVADTGTSWAIDAGAFDADYGQEPVPNGQRLNVGLYGDTSKASKSYTNEPALMAVTLSDGGTMIEPPTLYWLARGLDPTNTVTIEYSYDNGSTWLYVTSGVSIAQHGYYWVDTNPPSPEAFWKVTLDADNSVFDTNDTKFIKRTGPITYYVNDSNLVGDIYTTAVGHPDNSGYSSNAPKDSIWGILGNPDYDLAGNDRILVDTGHYYETNTITINAFNSGVDTASVDIIGSTNWLYDGSVLDWSNHTEVGLVFGEELTYVNVNNLSLQHAEQGVLFDADSMDCSLSNVVVREMLAEGASVNAKGHKMFRCVITRCNGAGVFVGNGGSANLQGCVIWSNSESALTLVRGGQARVSNSVIHVYNDDTYCYEMQTNAYVYGDFNNLYVGSNAHYVLYNGDLLLEGLPQWNLLTTQDIHSLSTAPAFMDASQDDYHLLSTFGRYDPATGGYVTSDLSFSRMIDAGATNAPYSNEPVPNGERVNIGLYGNTDQASKSDTNAWVYAITASSGGQLYGLFNLVWLYGGIDPTNEVQLDYSYDNGVNWTNIASAAIGDGQYLWVSDVKDFDLFRWYSSPIARWRIILLENTNVWDETDRFFSLRNEPFKYYLNDTSTVDDIYTTVVGNDTNLGFFPWAPKATLNALLDAADLEGEDSILFDTGRYLVGTNLFAIIGSSDQGKPGQPVYIQGNTNQFSSIIINTSAVKGTILNVDAGNMDVADLGFENGNICFPGDGVSLHDITVTNGSVDISGFGQSVYRLCVTDGDVEINARTATVDRLSVLNGSLDISGTNIVLLHALTVASNGPVVGLNGVDVKMANSTLLSGQTALRVEGTDCTVSNSIIVAEGVGNFCIHWVSGGLVSDGNNLLARDGAWIGNRDGYWEKLLYWQRASELDANSISAEPLFVDEAGGDYRLQSLTGHWTAGGWVADAQHSPCIDFGSVLASATNEPEPNGGLVNLGAYGDTEQASKSLTNAWLLAVTMNDGGVLRGTNALYWRFGNLGGTDLVRVEYSADGGVTWVTNATGLSATTGAYTWDTTQNASSFNALWRVVLISDTSVFDQCDASFAVRNTNVIFYVNDASLTGDVYCGAAGNAVNDGLTTNTPKDSIQHVLNAYDTEGGDRIRVDTGSYNLTQDVTVIWSRGGDDEYGDLVIQGSTNFAAGGSRLYRGGLSFGKDGFNIPASRVSVADMGIFDAYRAVYFWSNIYCSADGLLLASNMYGVYGEGTFSVTTRHSRLVENDIGVYWLRTRTADVVNCTFINNSNADISLDSSISDVIYNNIYYRSVSNAVYEGTDGTLGNTFIDYNIYYLLKTNAIWGGYTDLMTWQLQKNHDFRSAFTNPLMVDVVNGDYHIQSTAGRYIDGVGWIPAVLDGWGIDKGSPGCDYSLEPSVNGDRINIGAYGGTIYASKGYTNTVVHTRTLNQEMHIDYTNSLWPLIWTVQDVPTDVTFSVEYSGDNGASWYVLTNGVNPYQEYHIWQTSPFFNTYAGLWRVISDDGSYSDTNDAPFDIFYGDYEITHEGLNGDLNFIVWVGAWSENYRVQYSDAWMSSSNGINWYNAPTGAGPNQTPWFDAPNGGDLTYEDIESTNKPYRLYRVIWDDAL